VLGDSSWRDQSPYRAASGWVTLPKADAICADAEGEHPRQEGHDHDVGIRIRRLGLDVDPTAKTAQPTPRQILDERYARGELTTEEYRERVETLGGKA